MRGPTKRFKPNPWEAVAGDWSIDDDRQSKQQGWGLYFVGFELREDRIKGRGGEEWRPFELYSSDPERSYIEDDLAVEFVQKQAKANDPLALKAKAFLKKYSQPEHDKIFGPG